MSNTNRDRSYMRNQKMLIAKIKLIPQMEDTYTKS